MRLGFAPALSLALALLAAAGCEPKCREIEPIAVVQEKLGDQIDDRLDDADASDAQRAKIKAMFATLRPAIERMRAEALPVQVAIVRELQRGAPDRKVLTKLIDRNVDAVQTYVHALADVVLKAHPVLTSTQRKQLAVRMSRPSPSFEGSFWIDRAVDYLMLKIDATSEQRRWFDRIQRHVLDRGRKLQQQFDAIRVATAAELVKDEPDPARVHAVFERGRGLAREALIDLAGFYLLFASKLEPHQRTLLAAELVRFEPCNVPAQRAPQLSARP